MLTQKMCFMMTQCTAILIKLVAFRQFWSKKSSIF